MEEKQIALIGFGEAAQAFVGAMDSSARVRAFDTLTQNPKFRRAKFGDYATAGVTGCGSCAEAMADAKLVLSLVTADQALVAARAAAPHFEPEAFWFDMNSVAPSTKRSAAKAVESGGGRYVDVAVMAPAHPLRLAVPLLVAGPHGEAGCTALRALGFTDVRAVGETIGAAAAVKMIRSVMIKGLEALTAECLIAAEAAGVVDEVIASLEASEGPAWEQRANYRLDRMLVHGSRRAAEMEEAVKTLISLNIRPLLSRGTVERQRAIGELSVTQSPTGLKAKLAVLDRQRKDVAA